jgi:hypothetical protein
MSKIHYFAGGSRFNGGKDEIFSMLLYCNMFNPTKREATVKSTVYFEKKDPVTFSQTAAPEAKVGLAMVDSLPERTYFAAKIETSEPMVIQFVNLYQNTVCDMEMRAAFASLHTTDELSRTHYTADNIWAEADFVSETEDVFFLNPGPMPAHVKHFTYPHPGNPAIKPREFTVQPQRLYHDDCAKIYPNEKGFSNKWVSDLPIYVQLTRRLISKKPDKHIISMYWIHPPTNLRWQDDAELSL